MVYIQPKFTESLGSHLVEPPSCPGLKVVVVVCEQCYLQGDAAVGQHQVSL